MGCCWEGDGPPDWKPCAVTSKPTREREKNHLYIFFHVIYESPHLLRVGERELD